MKEFSTDTLSVVVRPTKEESRQYLPEELQKDSDVDGAIKGGTAFSVLAAWPGSGEIPPAQKWGDEYAVIIPDSGKGAEYESEPWKKTGSDQSLAVLRSALDRYPKGATR